MCTHVEVPGEMDGSLGETDRRAVAVGAVVGAVVTLTAAGVTAATLDGRWVRTVVFASPVAGLLAGAVAAYASRERMQPFREGAYAAVSGLLCGIGAWMVAVSAVTPAHSLDVFLLLSPFGFLGAFVALPMSFLAGGVAGYTTLMYGV
jgi:hypothetical protein